MKLISCAIVALCLFAQIVRAQGEDEAAVNKEIKAVKQDDEQESETKLKDRSGSRYGGSRGESVSFNKVELGKSRHRSGKRHNGNWQPSKGAGSGGLRNNRGNRNFGSISNNNRLANNGNDGVIIQNLGVTNKVIPGYVRILPTVETRSRERHDVRSESDSYYKQNSASVITQNNKRKQTFIHTHLNQVVYHPRHVNHIHKHHHTTYIKQLFPEVTKIRVNQKQKIVEPEKLTIIKYTQNANFENKVYPTTIRHGTRYEQLKTIREPVRNLGVKNIGNPLHINANDNGHGVKGLRFETAHQGIGGNNYNRHGNGLYGNKAYAHLGKRAGEDVKSEVEIAVKPEQPAVEEAKPVETQPASNILEQRSASIKAA